VGLIDAQTVHTCLSVCPCHCCHQRCACSEQEWGIRGEGPSAHSLRPRGVPSALGVPAHGVVCCRVPVPAFSPAPDQEPCLGTHVCPVCHEHLEPPGDEAPLGSRGGVHQQAGVLLKLKVARGARAVPLVAGGVADGGERSRADRRVADAAGHCRRQPLAGVVGPGVGEEAGDRALHGDGVARVAASARLVLCAEGELEPRRGWVLGLLVQPEQPLRFAMLECLA